MGFEEPSTVDSLVAAKAAANGDSPFVHYGDDTVTYREVEQRSTRVANGLADLGVQPGENVAVFMRNSLEYVYVFFALAKLRAVMVPLNVSLRGDDLAYHVTDSEASVAIVDADLADVFVDEYVETIIAVGGDRELTFQELLDAPADPIERDVAPSDPFSIIYTSGTTGMPKGVVLPHRSYISTAREYSRNIGIRSGDVWYTSLPLFHGNAQQTTLLGSMANDIEMALGDKFSASEFWNRIETYDATVFNYIGAIISILHNQDSHPAENPVRVATGGGAPPEIRERFEREHDLTVLEGYGLTETGVSTTKVTPEMDERARYETIGRPVDSVEVAILDDDDHQLPPGEHGEIAVRPNEPYKMMLEYYDKPDETVDAWQNLWFHTGDIGYMDEEGYVYFVDRKTFSIRRRGENVSSREVERAILQHPSVTEAAVVGVPSELGDEEVKAYVVGDVEPDELVEYLQGDLADFKIPRYVELVEDLPMTETERVQKKRLADRGVNDAWDRFEAR